VAWDPGLHRVVVDGDAEVARDVELVAGEEATIDLPRNRPPPRAPSVHPSSTDAATSSFSPGILSYLGAGAVLAGAAGTVGFGLRAAALHEDNQRMPTHDNAQDGSLMRDLTNVSIGVLVVGTAVILVDLLFVGSSGDAD
jgi:hypothetical protein